MAVATKSVRLHTPSIAKTGRGAFYLTNAYIDRRTQVPLSTGLRILAGDRVLVVLPEKIERGAILAPENEIVTCQAVVRN